MGVKSILHKSFTISRETFKQSHCPLYKKLHNCVPKLKETCWSNISCRPHPLPGFLYFWQSPPDTDWDGVSGIARGNTNPLLVNNPDTYFALFWVYEEDPSTGMKLIRISGPNCFLHFVFTTSGNSPPPLLLTPDSSRSDVLVRSDVMCRAGFEQRWHRTCHRILLQRGDTPGWARRAVWDSWRWTNSWKFVIYLCLLLLVFWWEFLEKGECISYAWTQLSHSCIGGGGEL